MSFPFLTPLTATAALMASPENAETPPDIAHGLTAVAGLEVGHFELAERPTGCTVVLAKSGAVAGVDVRGGAPGSRELALLDPVQTVQQVHAVVLAGGSAFGLDAASGVMRYLEERGIGFNTGRATVPIVPSAILYDLGISAKSHPRPDAESGYQAALAASSGLVAEGSVGAGKGATVGKLLGMERAMKGGLGSAAIRLEGGLTIGALVVANAVGDVVDPETGQLVAGARTADGRGLADQRDLLRRGALLRPMPAQNTTLGIVATNARLSKVEATKVAQMAQDGLARTLYPAHTPWDGDTIFALSTGRHDGPVDVLTIGALAADRVAEAILRAVRKATGLPGLPTVSELAEIQSAERR